MARIQRSIEINVPVHAAYSKLTQFEEYPRFMQDVEAVHQLDDTHLHWSAKMSNRNMEWDSEITERLPDRCIAWRNLSGPHNAGKVELQPIGQEKASVTLTVDCDPGQMLASQDGNAETAMTQRLWEDLARFKKLVETRDAETGAWRDSQHEQPQAGAQAARSTQSEASISRLPHDQTEQGRFSVSEEQNFDQQSDQARRVGRMPQATAGTDPADAMSQSMQQPGRDANARGEMAMALDRAVPRSDPAPAPTAAASTDRGYSRGR